MKRSLTHLVLGACVAAGCSNAVLSRRSPSAMVSSTAVSCRATAGNRAGAPGVRWTTPDTRAEQLRLDSWCAGVGPTLMLDGGAAEVPALEDLVFISWNVHVGHADIARFMRDLRSGRFSTGHPPRHLILMLQEAIRSGDVPDAVPETASTAGRIGPADADAVGIGRVAQQLNLSLFYVPSMRDGSVSSGYAPADRGNAILSTLPLTKPSAIELPGGGQRRVAAASTVSVTVDGRSVPLSIGAAHLSTRATAKSAWVFGAAGQRRRQAQALIAALPASGPMLLGADLNTWMRGPNEPAARDLMRAFPATPNEPREPTAGAGLVLDYMFFRPPAGWHARLVRAPERYGSDHYPLVGWLEPPSAPVAASR